MESTESEIADRRPRYKVVLGKFPVVKILEHATYLEFVLQFPGGVALAVTGPKADVREGDLLTLYTEILAIERTH